MQSGEPQRAQNSPALKLKRVYEPPSPADGQRTLVDRLWPRGVSKRSGVIDLWLKDIAPSAALRRWFAHDPTRWPEFRRRYRSELARNQEAVATLRSATRAGAVTLVYAAREPQNINAVVLAEYLLSGAGNASRSSLEEEVDNERGSCVEPP